MMPPQLASRSLAFMGATLLALLPHTPPAYASDVVEAKLRSSAIALLSCINSDIEDFHGKLCEVLGLHA